MAQTHAVTNFRGWFAPERPRNFLGSFLGIYEKVKHLTECTFYTDDWSAFPKVFRDRIG